MERTRQIKLLSIVALVVAIAGMTLGFAAFSTTLNISSSATVTPSNEDFKIVVYGLPENYDKTLVQNNAFLDTHYTSTTSLHPLIGGKWNSSEAPYSASVGTISHNSNSIVISNIYAEFVNQNENVVYMFMIKNEGKYDSYMSVEQIGKRICTAKEGDMSTLMEDACTKFTYSLDLATSSKIGIYNENMPYLLQKGDYIIGRIGLYNYYGQTTLPDGAMDIIFPDVQINFTTAQ